MQQLNAYRFYELGARLHSLFGSGTQNRVADMFAPLTEAQALLDSFIKGDLFALDSSKADANRLLSKISSVFNRYFIDPTTRQLKESPGEDRIDTQEVALIHSLIEKFEHALAAELNRTPSYVAGKRGIYSTYDLAQNAETIFSDNLRKIIPLSAQTEFHQAGRALAFGLGTAASIHMLRAVDITLRSYFESFAGAAAKGEKGEKTERNYTIYLKKLLALSEDEEARHRPDKRIVQMLGQIKEQYRNPLVTPENTISIDEATQLFAMASAIVSQMAEHMAARQQADSRQANRTPVPSTSTIADEDDDMYEFRVSQAS